MSDDMDKRTEFLLSRRGITYVRWRAVRAYLLSKPPCPSYDPALKPVLGRIDTATVDHLAQEFRDAFNEASRMAKELATDRHPYPTRQERNRRYPTILSTQCDDPDCECSQRNALRRTHKWLGQLAFAKGIDRSPTHDRHVARSIRKYPNDLALELLRSWEAGWDDAYDYAAQLKMERMSILEIPRVIDARSIPKNHGSSRKG